MQRVVFAVLLLACSGSKEQTTKQLVDKYRAQIEPKLAAIDKLRAAPLPAPTEHIELDGPMLRFSNYEPYGNVVFAYRADLQDMTRYQPNPLRYNFMAEVVNDCYLTVRDGNQAIVPNGNQVNGPTPAYIAKQLLPMCAAARYLIVVDLQAFKDTQYIDKQTFGGGGAAAAAHVFDLETGKYLGGVSFTASSSGETTDPDADLREQFDKAMDEAIHKVLPDAKLS